MQSIRIFILFSSFVTMLAHADGCETSDIKLTRNHFNKAYKSGDLDKAEQLLSSKYDECYRDSDLHKSNKVNDYYWLVSDLMFVKIRTGDLNGCAGLGQVYNNYFIPHNREKLSNKLVKSISYNFSKCADNKQKNVFPLSYMPRCNISGYSDYYQKPIPVNKSAENYYGNRTIQCLRLNTTRPGVKLASSNNSDVIGISNQSRVDVVYADHEWKKWYEEPSVISYKVQSLYFSDLDLNKESCVDGDIYYPAKANTTKLLLDGDTVDCNSGKSISEYSKNFSIDFMFQLKVVSE